MAQKSRCYQIGWNMAADDLHPLPSATVLGLAEDVVANEFPRALDEASRRYHENEFIRGYNGQFAWRIAQQGVAR